MRKLSETQITSADVKALLNKASFLRKTPTGLGKKFKMFRKETVDIGDLQKAWAETGYSDDTVDISRILKDHGFDVKEINKVFSMVFGKSEHSKDGYANPVASHTIQKVADYIKNAGLTDDVIKFMRDEYKLDESMDYPTKSMIEDVRQIFTAIVHEERSARDELIRQDDKKQLGRGKK